MKRVGIIWWALIHPVITIYLNGIYEKKIKITPINGVIFLAMVKQNYLKILVRKAKGKIKDVWCSIRYKPKRCLNA